MANGEVIPSSEITRRMVKFSGGVGEVLFDFYVALMSRGVAGSDWELLKRKENCCDKLQHGGG